MSTYNTTMQLCITHAQSANLPERERSVERSPFLYETEPTTAS